MSLKDKETFSPLKNIKMFILVVFRRKIVRNWSKAHISVAPAQPVSPLSLVLVWKETTVGLMSSLRVEKDAGGHVAIKKKAKGEKKESDLTKVPKHQLVTPNPGQVWPVFLSLSQPPPGSVFCGLVGRISEKRWNRTELRAFWFYFCFSVCFCF